jgi:putative PEP-CTERM system histidine kinase
LCATALALAVLAKRRNAAEWAFAGAMLALAFESICVARAVVPGLAASDVLQWQQWSLVAASALPGCWLLFSLCYARGNAGEFLARWRWPVGAAFVIPVGLALLFRAQLFVSVRIAGTGSPYSLALGWSGLALNLLLLASAILILTNLERTFRASVGTIRWRIKFMLMAVGLILLVRIFTASQALLFRGTYFSLEYLNSGAVVVAAALTLRSLFRAGKIDLDVYPSQAVLQGSATVLLAGIYLLVVGLSAKAVVIWGGGDVFLQVSLLILVSLVVLVALLQSDRIRMRMGRFVSRNFQRPLYDYRMVWRKFTEGTTSQADQTELCRSLVKLVADVFQCLSVAIWIVDEKDESLVLAASTFLSQAKGRELALSRAEAREVIAYFLKHPEPADIETREDHFAVLLRRAHPCEFPKKENRVCLPMIARGQVIALIVLGDRVGGAVFSTQDFDMLKCVGDHATANLLNVRFAQQLLQAKEMEAFQTMAAFFVHDLKNAASTLSLMLKNMPVHFDDPAFREDALRGVSKSVAHINHVIGRLGLLRHELKIRPVMSDLNEVVAQALAGLESEPGFSIVKELPQLPRVALDREQISKVITNLVLNAKEAMSGTGEMWLSTGQENGWVVLKVRDSGCGMAPEFIERSLFRPFQTTKKNGLGIGMFQSKMIVEVHGGRIAVASQPGAGTTFQVFLPVKTRAE